jgi:hypothetical protein
MHLVQVISVNIHCLSINLQNDQVLGEILIVFPSIGRFYCMFCRLYLNFGQTSKNACTFYISDLLNPKIIMKLIADYIVTSKNTEFNFL